MRKQEILPPDQMRLILELANTHLPGVEIWAYGSRVGCSPRRYSDLDLVAFTNPGQRLLADNLRQAFEESDLPIRVDLFLWDDLPESFQNQIVQQYVVLQRAEEIPVAEAD